jgi:sucrose-6-phosphate hydrolase SacC (GH32 family)
VEAVREAALRRDEPLPWGCDLSLTPEAATLTLDRSGSGSAFHPGFLRSFSVELEGRSTHLELRLVVDRSSVEVLPETAPGTGVPPETFRLDGPPPGTLASFSGWALRP